MARLFDGSKEIGWDNQPLTPSQPQEPQSSYTPKPVNQGPTYDGGDYGERRNYTPNLPQQNYTPLTQQNEWEMLGGGQQQGLMSNQPPTSSHYWETPGFSLNDQQAGQIWTGLEGLWNNYLTNQWQTPQGVTTPMRRDDQYIYMQTPEGIRKWTYNSNLGEGVDPNLWNARNFFEQNADLYGDFWNSTQNWGYGAAPQRPTVPDQPPIADPGGIRPDQGAEIMPDGSVRIPGTEMGSPIDPEDATNAGMGAAWEAMQNMFSNPQYYPGWWGKDYQTLDASKWQNAYPEFQTVPGYNGIDIPGQYQGLMEGDYNRLESSLRTPGEIAAQNAFKQGGDYLKNVMGGQGMYGSSVMGNQANTGLNQKYMDTMASNAAQAAASRYGLQQSDLQFGANNALQRGDLMRQDALDQYKAAMTQRNLLNDYNNNRFQFDYGLGEAARGERNNLLQNRFQYDLASQAWRNAMNENLMNAGLAFAGKSGNLANANRNYAMLQQQYNDQSRQNQVGMGLDLADRFGITDWAKNKVSSGLGSIFDNWTW